MMFPYKWSLADGYPAKDIEYHGTTVMSTFACGGGSTMGYKLAGYDVIAANDIDPRMAKVYKANHKPKQFFECSVKELLAKDDLPEVDLLDGSPPCSVFSIVGKREQGWQTAKHFTEGQAKQILDDLFFDFIDLVKKMQPKIVIAENVKGMLQGSARWYTREIVRRFKAIGYNSQVFLLNTATMGLPQKRERVFFIANKGKKKIELKFEQEKIYYKEVHKSSGTELQKVSPLEKSYWEKSTQGGSVGKFNAVKRLALNKVPNTLVSGHINFDAVEPRKLYKEEILEIGSFPGDYNFLDINPQYLVGMSVPPIMMAQVAYQVYNQLIRG